MILDVWSFIRRGLLADLVCPAETWVGRGEGAEQGKIRRVNEKKGGCKTRNESGEDSETTNLSAM